VLPGQETLLGSWAALAQTSPGARLIRTSTVVAAVFPHWQPLNNAIVLDRANDAAEWSANLYHTEGVDSWALWIPSDATDFEAPDVMSAVGRLTRDTTTLVMRAALRAGPEPTEDARPCSLTAALRAGDEPVPLIDLGEPERTPGLAAWVLIRADVAVAGAWTYRNGDDCGLYTVGTAPAWRRRGLATALMRHVLAKAAADGATSATLQSTPMAQRLYESLGFVAAGRYEEWVP
jgi:ribosomal protein S18 acetylase RimI-like enzyme